jgi:hypothetical protein
MPYSTNLTEHNGETHHKPKIVEFVFDDDHDILCEDNVHNILAAPNSPTIWKQEATVSSLKQSITH